MRVVKFAEGWIWHFPRYIQGTIFKKCSSHIQSIELKFGAADMAQRAKSIFSASNRS